MGGLETNQNDNSHHVVVVHKCLLALSVNSTSMYYEDAGCYTDLANLTTNTAEILTMETKLI